MILPYSSVSKKILVTGPNANNHSVLEIGQSHQTIKSLPFMKVLKRLEQARHQLIFMIHENIRTLCDADIARTAAEATNYNLW